MSVWFYFASAVTMVFLMSVVMRSLAKSKKFGRFLPDHLEETLVLAVVVSLLILVLHEAWFYVKEEQSRMLTAIQRGATLAGVVAAGIGLFLWRHANWE